jgi:hypothetical protein
MVGTKKNRNALNGLTRNSRETTEGGSIARSAGQKEEEFSAFQPFSIS